MKKAVVIMLALSLTVTLFTVTPARADQFWPGVAIGVGSAILLGSLLNPPRDYYYAPRPVRVYSQPDYYYPPPPVVRVYSPPAYYCPPPPPVYRERWIPGRVVERHGHYGNFERSRGSRHWDRRY